MDNEAKETVQEGEDKVRAAQQRWRQRKQHLLRYPAQAMPEEVRKLLVENARMGELHGAARPLVEAVNYYEQLQQAAVSELTYAHTTAVLDMLAGARRLLRVLAELAP